MPKPANSLVFTLLSLILFVTTFAISLTAQTTIKAASCNQSDVQTALNSATAGSTVRIPAGTCTWTTGIAWNAPANATILGAGSQTTTGGGDATVIIDGVSHSPNDNPMLQINTGAAGTSFRLSGITFKDNSASSTSYNGSIGIGGNSTLVRIDHVHLALLDDGKQMGIGGCVYGVMDHSIVDEPAGSTYNGVFLDQGDCGEDALGVGNGQWNEPTALGSVSSFYFENNVFNGGTNGSSDVVPFADDCSGGGRFVFRYNTLNGVTIQGHGTGHSDDPPDRGCRAYEIYQNTFTGGTAAWPVFDAFYDTSGTGVVWGNNVTGYYQSFITGHVNRASNDTYGQSAPPAGWGYCGTAMGPSAWDGNTNSTGYPCLDQIGRGQGDLLQGNFPTVCDASASDCANSVYTGRWPRQALEPVYLWLNAWTPVPNWPSTLWNEYDPSVVQNRDYYLYTSSFNGTAGVGSGTLAARPSTCTKGVAYWATDQGNWNHSGSGGQGELFVCSAVNTWTLYYVPYTYPHPLVQAPAPDPNAPTGLTAAVH